MRRSVFSEQAQDNVRFLHSLSTWPLPAVALRRAWLRLFPMWRLVIGRIPCHIRGTVRASSSTDAARDTRPSFSFVRASIILPGARHISQVDTQGAMT